jgi:hypothetical protein
MKPRNDPAAEDFMVELFGKEYTEEQCKITAIVVAGIAHRFTSCSINFNMDFPQFVPAVDSNYLLKLSKELVKEKGSGIIK